ncbi:MAG: glucuronyl hydrolase [Bacteroidia bacterium]|nr:glucuronyl hydrolase [Bacteroidia bacterium]
MCLDRLSILAASHTSKDSIPRSWDESKGQIIADPPHVWTVGFYPACLWKAFAASGDSSWKDKALAYLPLLEKQSNNRSTHDLGFMIFLGLGSDQFPDIPESDSLKKVMLQAAESLYSRYNQSIGAIKSYDVANSEQFPVIIDNLINLELLLWAGGTLKDSSFTKAAMRHGEFTQRYFVRKSEGCKSFHKIEFNPSLTEKHQVFAGQGAGSHSVWSRGSAWGIYGFSMLYTYLHEEQFLATASCMADYWLENVPEDGIPYWDFEARQIPNVPRDASAAAIAAAGLLQLATKLPPKEGSKYFFQAEKSLKSLSHPTYFLPEGKPFILDHSTLSIPHKIDVDRPQTMADYYFIEAILRYIAIAPLFKAEPQLP